MKPIRLEISGLQSFSKKQIIDFEALSSLGIFGIFGETGSGKSTILDAMILALFDEIPRLKGINKSIRACLNHDSDMIEIVFVFSLKNRIFEIYRAYKRRFNKKGEERFEQVNPILKIDGVVVADTVRNFATQIEEHLGITANDFTRTVILPQGRFSEFLKLKANDKMSMLENIFDLERYGTRMSDKLKARNNKLKDEILSLENQLKGMGEVSIEELENLKQSLSKNEMELQNLSTTKFEQEKRYDEMKELKKDYTALSDYKERLEKLREKSKDIDLQRKKIENSEVAEVLNSLVKEIDELKKEITSNEEKVSNHKKRIESLGVENSKLQELIELKNNKLLESEKKLKSFDYNSEELEKLRGLEKILIEIDSKNRYLESIDKINSESEKDIERLKTQSTNNIEMLQRMENELKTLEIVDKDLVYNLEREREDISYKILNLKECRAKYEEISNSLEMIETKLEKSLNKKEKLEKEIEEINSNRYQYYAYILAKNLEKDSSCPVCGSTNHIKLADSESSFDEKKYEKLLKDMKNIEFEIVELEKEKEIKTEEKQRVYSEESLEQLESKNQEIKIKIDDYKSKEKEIERKRVTNTTKISELLKQNNEIDEKLQETTSRQERLSLDIETAKKDIAELKNEMERAGYSEDKRDEVLERKGFLESCEEQRKIVLKEKESIEQDISKSKDEILELSSKITEESMRYSSIFERNQLLLKLHLEKTNLLDRRKEEFKIDKEVDTSEWILSEEKKRAIKEDIESYEKDTQKYLNLIESVEAKIGDREFSEESWRECEATYLAILESEKRYIAEIEKTKAELNRYIELEKKSKHILSELEKVRKKQDTVLIMSKRFDGRKFVKFLAQKKLNYITFEASKRLQKITKGRYLLTVDKSCEFNIIDNFNGSVMRDCSTLSGGETFIVSLVLALALSTQLQLKGGIDLEFFFLDEGFGTLDDTLLERVIEILEEIRWSESLKIGIISHVNELKIRIPRRLEVYPPVQGECGTKVKMF